VAGFDDIPVARYLTPPLTSVGVSITGLGGFATDKLLRVIGERNEHAKQNEILPVRLTVRDSTATRPHEPEGSSRSPLSHPAA
jgi:LacI family transcriptional regulator